MLEAHQANSPVFFTSSFLLLPCKDSQFFFGRMLIPPQTKGGKKSPFKQITETDQIIYIFYKYLLSFQFVKTL